MAILLLSPVRGMLNERALVDLLATLRGSGWAPLALVAGIVVFCSLGLPATPFLLAGGVVFGAFVGGLYNLAGTLGTAAVSYFLGQSLARDLVAQLLGDRLRKVEETVARGGFWNLVRVRFLPIPFAITNYGAALAGVRPLPYLASSAIGLVPPTFLYAYFADSLIHAVGAERKAIVLRLTLAVLGLLALTFLPNLIAWFRRRRQPG